MKLNKPIRIHPVVASEDSERLNLFAGRYLSEQEFDLMQRYVDKRCEDLLLHRYPGVVDGLDVSINRNGSELSIRVQPGTAIGGDGRGIQVFFPIDLDWASLLESYRRRVTPPDAPERDVHGFYFLTLRRSVATVYETEEQDPCARDQLDPTQDSRIETFGTLDLQFISDLPSLMSMEQARAANRICASQLTENIFATSAIPIALLKIDTDELQWIDVVAGRYESSKNASYQTFLAHWQNLVNEGATEADNAANLASNLGVDFLPSAGPFPDNLITNIAGDQNVDDPAAWNLPDLNFSPEDLQIELVPVPANTTDGTIANEVARGHISLVHHQQDRIRIMVAVDEENYRANLLDLPDIDRELVDDLYQRYVVAASDYNEWANQYYSLYANIDRDVSFTGDTADEDSQILFDALYKVAGPVDDFPNITTEARRQGLGIRPSYPATQTVENYFTELVSARRSRLNDGDILPRPYSMPAPGEPQDLADVAPDLESNPEDGLYRQQEDYKNQIAAIEADLENSFELLDEINDFISVQRQHLDSITVSFAQLAGGVQGDGSGLNLMRWTANTRILPAAIQIDEGGS